jgi:protein-S-isoprenylcysteine O-methyltransferase Ste14
MFVITSPAIQYAGLVLIVFGTVIRTWAILLLGCFFSRSVQVVANQKVIKEGIYHVVHHPAYTGMLMIYAGFVLSLGTWAGTLAALAPISAATLYRIRVEEKALLEGIEEEYRVYMQQTWRLIPGW